MKEYIIRILSFLLAVLLFVGSVPAGVAAERPLSLAGYIQSSEKRHFAEAMLSYHLRENTTVQKTLAEGYSALFFFEGCSDNMEDKLLSDQTYYRVGAVCIAVKLDENGAPQITYFNEDSSTLPDRPLEYGAWSLKGIGKVGPATVCDGTYELYSVYHAGSYEALHMRTSYEDDTIAAVYMTPEGYVSSAANAINIHTRTGNHVIERAMWSAGCLLVGDGNWDEYADLIINTYYSNYGKFQIDRKVGCVTINRQYLQEDMYDLYESREAVDTLLVSSRCENPRVYMERCSDETAFEVKTVQISADTTVMSLPCTNTVDSRSIPVTKLVTGDKIDICGSIVNTKGQLWYEVSFFGENCFVPAGSVAEIELTLREKIAGFFK